MDNYSFDAPPTSRTEFTFLNNFFPLTPRSIENDFQHGVTWMTDEADGSDKADVCTVTFSIVIITLGEVEVGSVADRLLVVPQLIVSRLLLCLLVPRECCGLCCWHFLEVFTLLSFFLECNN